MKFIRHMQEPSVVVPLSLVILCFLLLTPLETRSQNDFFTAHVRSVEGKPTLSSSMRPGTFPLRQNYSLEPDNIIETGNNGRVVISLSDGSQVIVLPNSRVKFKDFYSANSARELLEILFGRVRVKIHHVGGVPNPYRLNSPAASIAVRGTEFIVDVLSSGETSVYVFEGLVEVVSLINPDNKRLVAPGDRVIVRPGGDISLAFPGPGGEINGKTRVYKGVEQIYQQSVESLVQNSTEVSPLIFSAFPDTHLDSIENPAYAAEFTTAQGRISLLPSISEPDSQVVIQTSRLENDLRKAHPPARFDYSVTPQLSFFTPVPNTRLTLGASISAIRTSLHDLSRYEGSYQSMAGMYQYSNNDYNAASLNLFNTSLIAAYSLGPKKKTSIGIELDKLSGNGSYANNYSLSVNGSSLENLVSSKAQLARTRLSMGFSHDFSGGRKLGLYFRQGFSSSDQQYKQQLTVDEGFPYLSSYFYRLLDRTDVSTISSEFGARWRAPLTRRIFYGVEASYLYEKISSEIKLVDKTFVKDRDRAQRARLGGGLGYAFKSKTLFNLDVVGGFYKTTKPPGYFRYAYYQSEEGEQGKFLSTHAAMQTNVWRNAFASASFLITVRKNYLDYGSRFNAYGVISLDQEINKFSTSGVGWKFTPNLIAQYLISIDHTRYSRHVPSHSLMLRYTFDLKITNEK